MTDDSLHDVLNRLQQGENEAAQEVFSRFAHQLIRVARSRLNRNVRSKVDEDDVLQSVFRTFFRRQKEEAFHLENWDSLWGLLVVITIRKCGKQAEFLQAACRDVRQEVRGHGEDGSPDPLQNFASHEPQPEEAAALTETVEKMMQGLTEQQREMLVMKLQGYEVREIAAHIGRTERTVFRFLAAVKEQLLQSQNS